MMANSLTTFNGSFSPGHLPMGGCSPAWCSVALLFAVACLGCTSEPPPPKPIADRGKLAVPIEELEVEEILPPAEAESIEYPAVEQWDNSTPAQRARALRSFAELKQRSVPVYPGRLLVEDDDQVRLQDAAEVARRAIILWALALRAEGTPQEEVAALIDKADAWDSVSPSEREIFQATSIEPGVADSLVWRLESLWVMLWALGHVEQLHWPDDMCNVPRLVEIMRAQESNPAFIQEAKLRDVDQILDAQDLTMRINWAIRESSLREQATIPLRLDWSGEVNWVPIVECPGVGVTEERHHALNWLVQFLAPENWDEVDTPT
jgi:hypothetical protein